MRKFKEGSLLVCCREKTLQACEQVREFTGEEVVFCMGNGPEEEKKREVVGVSKARARRAWCRGFLFILEV